MAFLLAEREARSKERQEDMEQIKKMIQAGVKDEVVIAVKPLQGRLESQEKETIELKKQVSEVLEKVKSLQETTKTSEVYPSLPEIRNLGSFYKYKATTKQNSDQGNLEHAEKVRELYAEARKVIGLTPIEPRMLELQIQCCGAKKS